MRLFDGKIALSVPGGRKNAYLKLLLGAAATAALFLLISVPLNKSIAAKRAEWKKLEAQILVERRRLDMYLKLDKAGLDDRLEQLRRRLPSRNPASAVLDELTRRGKEFNIEFVAIKPQSEKSPPAGRPAGSALRYKILPIEINMRATYRSLGEYLGVLENLESCFATVGGFQVKKDEKIFPKLNVQLIIYTYILQEGEGGYNPFHNLVFNGHRLCINI